MMTAIGIDLLIIWVASDIIYVSTSGMMMMIANMLIGWWLRMILLIEVDNRNCRWLAPRVARWYDLCFDECTVERQDFVDWIWQSELLMIATQDRVPPWFLDVGSDNDIWDRSLRPAFQNPLFFSRQWQDWCGNIIVKFHEELLVVGFLLQLFHLLTTWTWSLPKSLVMYLLFCNSNN